MTTDTPEEMAYYSTPIAVMPSVFIRSVILSVVFTAVVAGFAVVTSGGVPPLDRPTVVRQELSQFATLLGLVFVLMVLTVLGLAYVDYRRRQYVFEEDGLAEIRGITGPETERLAYDEIEDVSYTCSRLQRVFGSGTVRINDIEHEDADVGAELHARYLRQPEMFYSQLRSAVTSEDATERQHSFEEEPLTEDISSLSGEMLAADTSSSYMMPRAVLHPDSRQSGLYGLLAGLFLSVFVVPLVVFVSFELLVFAVSGADDSLFVWISGVVFVGFVGLVTARFYRAYDGTQYEIYDDHLRKVSPDEKTSVQFSAVRDVTRPGTGDGNARLWERGNMGHVALIGEDDEQLVVLEYVENPDEVETRLEELVAQAR